jgi:hypothetical protein
MSLKVGDTIYERQYGNHVNASNRWEPVVITGETSRSWLTGDLKYKHMVKKVPKKDLAEGTLRSHCITEAETQQHNFVDDNKWKIAQACQGVDDYAKLKAIADIIGYKEKPNG